MQQQELQPVCTSDAAATQPPRSSRPTPPHPVSHMHRTKTKILCAHQLLALALEVLGICCCPLRLPFRLALQLGGALQLACGARAHSRGL